MKRLIKNGDVILDGTLTRYQKEKQAFEKLEKLEDIEEKLGIDLITLFKLIDALYVYSYGHTDIVRCLNDGVSLYDKSITIYNGTCVISYPLSEYGKSFALTKEELEHGQSSNQE